MLFLVDLAVLLVLSIGAISFCFFFPQIQKIAHSIKWKNDKIKVKRQLWNAAATVIPMSATAPQFDFSSLPKEAPVIQMANAYERKKAEEHKKELAKGSIENIGIATITEEERERIHKRILKVQRYVEAATLNVRKTNYIASHKQRMKNTAYRGYVCPPEAYEKNKKEK